MKLPSKAHELLQLSLNDLQTVLEEKKYGIFMESWCYNDKGKCYVCHAGAVLANTFKEDFELINAQSMTPDHMTKAEQITKEPYLQVKMVFINTIREGASLIQTAIRKYYIETHMHDGDVEARIQAMIGLKGDIRLWPISGKGQYELENCIGYFSKHRAMDYVSSEIEHDPRAREIYFTYIRNLISLFKQFDL